MTFICKIKKRRGLHYDSDMLNNVVYANGGYLNKILTLFREIKNISLSRQCENLMINM